MVLKRIISSHLCCPQATAESEMKSYSDSDAASSASTESGDLSSEESVVSDASDYLHVAASQDKEFTTPADRNTEYARALSKLLRDRPMLPPHPLDASQSWTDIEGGVELPLWHCAFKGCPMTCNSEAELKRHLFERHKSTIDDVIRPQGTTQ